MRSRWTAAIVAVAAALAMAWLSSRVRVPIGAAPRHGGRDVAYVPTPDAMVRTMLDLAEVTSRDFVIDLGSGDGRIAIAAAERGARSLGIEHDADLVQGSRQLAGRLGLVDRARFVRADFFRHDFSAATVITMYLNRRINLELRPRLLALRPGTRIVSNSFDLGQWQPDETVELTPGGDVAHLWYVPANADGIWDSAEGRLSLRQEFQVVQGTMTTGGRQVAIRDGRLRAAVIRFAVGSTEYTGQVDGATIRGVITRDGREIPWTARRRERQSERPIRDEHTSSPA
jgi:hypothetical protein